MENNSSLKMSKEERESLPDFLAAAEGAKGDALNVSVVKNANSGLTVGPIQMDVSKNPLLAKNILAVGEASGLAKQYGITADLLAKDHKALQAAGKIADVEAFAAAVLKTKEGGEALENAQQKQIEFVANTTDKVCAGSIPDAAAVCGTPSGRRRIAAYIHQNQPPFDELEGYFAGKKVTIGRRDKNDPG